MAVTVIEKDGRTWEGTSVAMRAVRRFQIVSDTVGDNESMTYTSLPTYNSSHPHLDGLVATKISFTEGQEGEKRIILAEVEYTRRFLEVSSPEPGEEPSLIGAVEEWGWDAGTEEKEMLTDVNGVDVKNSAGDPFDNVPQISAPAPVFTKVIKTAGRQVGAMSYNCKVNHSQIVIGDMTCPPKTVLCTVSEKRIFDDPVYTHRYTIQLKYRSNLVKIEAGNSTTQIGWDVSVTDAGMRELGTNNKLELIRTTDAETGKRCTVTSPELLNGQGKAVTRGQGVTVTPYNFRFAAYESVDFPTWFYSESGL